jgi:hypothetical protein
MRPDLLFSLRDVLELDFDAGAIGLACSRQVVAVQPKYVAGRSAALAFPAWRCGVSGWSNDPVGMPALQMLGGIIEVRVKKEGLLAIYAAGVPDSLALIRKRKLVALSRNAARSVDCPLLSRPIAVVA